MAASKENNALVSITTVCCCCCVLLLRVVDSCCYCVQLLCVVVVVCCYCVLLIHAATRAGPEGFKAQCGKKNCAPYINLKKKIKNTNFFFWVSNLAKCNARRLIPTPEIFY